MGGEWGVGASLAMEKVPPHRRGVLLRPAAGGLRRSAICSRRSATSSCSRAGAGGRCSSSADCRRCSRSTCARTSRNRRSGSGRKRRNWSAVRPRASSSHWKLFLYLVVLMTMMNFISHGTQDMYPTFLQRDWQLRRRSASRDHGDRERRRDPRRHCCSAISPIASGGAAPIVTALLLADRGDSALGVLADRAAARRRRVPDAVHGAGRVGRDPGAHQRALAGFGARLPARASRISAASRSPARSCTSRPSSPTI